MLHRSAVIKRAEPEGKALNLVPDHCSIYSDADSASVRCGEVGAKPKG